MSAATSCEVCGQGLGEGAGERHSCAGAPRGIVLTHHTTGHTIRVPHGERVELGREALGDEVLLPLGKASRRHCAIEYVDGRYLVSDLGSEWGTYVGVEKVDCAVRSQPLGDDELLWLGPELFVASLVRVSVPPTGPSAAGAGTKLPTQRRCVECSHPIEAAACPHCGTYNS